MHQKINIYHKDNLPSQVERKTISKFLFNHLGKYGDPQSDIEQAIAYAFEEDGKPGGLVIAISDQEELVCAVVVNKTDMSGYVPENLLVYIATHENQRGKGVGKKAMQSAIENTEGSIALHVEHDNPAKYLYEKMGFTNPYLEMRLNK